MPRKKFDPSNLNVLVSPDRYASLDEHRVLAMLPMLKHHVLADVGCGPGFFTVPLAKYVFDGRVYAIDIQQPMLDATKVAVDKVRLTNVDYLLSQESKLPLESDSLDGALMAFVLQEAEDRPALLKEVKRCMRKSAWLGILEWHAKETAVGPPLEQRIAEADLQKAVQKLGFRFNRRLDLNSNQYMQVWRR